MSASPALFDAIPATRERVPWVSVGRFPTRVERAPGLAPRGVDLGVKREDERGELYGGNKVRTLEVLFGAARARGRRRLVTFGGWGAHHVVATSIYGPRHGFTVEATLFPQPLDAHVAEQLAVDRAAGADLSFTGGYLGVLPARARALASGDAEWLAGGGSSPIGTLGWVSAGFELVHQIAAGELPSVDVVYAALGSCGTVAGLLWSLWAPRSIEIVAVRVVDSRFCGATRTRSLVRAVDRQLGPLARLRRGEPPRLRVDDRFVGRYGEATPASVRAVRDAAEVGLTLDPIYTGKVMAALLHDARAGKLEGRRILFLHSHNTLDLRPLLARLAAA